MFEGHWWFHVSPPLLSIRLLAHPLFLFFFLILSLFLSPSCSPPLPPLSVEPHHILIQEEREADKNLHCKEKERRKGRSER